MNTTALPPLLRRIATIATYLALVACTLAVHACAVEWDSRAHTTATAARHA